MTPRRGNEPAVVVRARQCARSGSQWPMAIMLCGVAVVVTQEAAESFLADNLTFATALMTIWLNDLVIEPLVIPLYLTQISQMPYMFLCIGYGVESVE